MTRGNIRDLIRKRLGETTSAFWSDTELNTWINDACKDIVFRTKCYKTNSYLTTVEDTAEYVLSTSFLNILSIFEAYLYQDGATWVKLDPTSRTELDNHQPGWLSADAGVPTDYYWDKDENVFGLYVKPNSDNAGTSYVKVYYARKFSDMTDDADEPTGIPEFLHKAATHYVTAFGYEQRGHGDKANDAWSKYFATLKDYLIESKREREDDDLIMVNYRNI